MSDRRAGGDDARSGSEKGGDEPGEEVRGDLGQDASGAIGPAWFRLRYQELFDFSPDCQFVTDPRGIILEANHAAAALLRCPKAFLLDKPLGLFMALGHRKQFYQMLTQVGGRGHNEEFESQVAVRDGTRDVYVRAVVVEGRDGGGTSLRWLIRDITERRRAEADRAKILQQLVTAQEDERRRIAREMHDSVGQLLAALAMTIQAVRDAGPLSPPALARLDEAQALADELGRTTHDLAIRLRPTALDDIGLDMALQHYIEGVERSGVEAHFQAAGMGGERFPSDVETTFYRFVQEALTNVFKHAGARIVSVVIECHDRSAIAVVEDDGAGFNPEEAAASRRLGLRGMHERLALLGGSLEIESKPGAGTTLIARIPLSDVRSASCQGEPPPAPDDRGDAIGSLSI